MSGGIIPARDDPDARSRALQRTKTHSRFGQLVRSPARLAWFRARWPTTPRSEMARYLRVSPQAVSLWGRYLGLPVKRFGPPRMDCADRTTAVAGCTCDHCRRNRQFHRAKDRARYARHHRQARPPAPPPIDHGTRMTTEQLEILATRWARGDTSRAIGNALGLSHNTIARRAKAMGLQRNRGPKPLTAEPPPAIQKWVCPHCGRLNALETHERSGQAVRVGCAHESPSGALQRARAAQLAVCRQLRIQMQEGSCG